MRFKIKTRGFNDIVDITPRVEEGVKKSKIEEGICLVSSPGSTIGITTIENEQNLLSDFKEFLERIAPLNKEYHHDHTWGEKNAPSHILSAIIKPFLTIPVENGRLILGTWQQIILVDFDTKPREREIIVKII